MATAASLILGGGAVAANAAAGAFGFSSPVDVLQFIRAGELPQHPIEVAYKHLVYEPAKRQIMQSIATYMAQKTVNQVYEKVREKIKSISKNIQRVARKLPRYLQTQVANQIKSLGDKLDLTDLSPKFVVRDLSKVQDFAVKKAKEFGIISKKYSDGVIDKIAIYKRLVKRAKENGWSAILKETEEMLKEARKKGQNVFTDKVPSDGTEYLGIAKLFNQNNANPVADKNAVFTDKVPSGGTEYLGIAELFNQNNTNPVADKNAVSEEDFLVRVPEGEMAADFLSGDKGVVDQNAKKRLREPIRINEVDLPGPKERKSAVDDVSDLIDAALGRRKKIKLSKGAKIAKGLLNGDLPSQFSNISISDIPTVINRVNKANRQKLYYNTFRAGRSNDYIPTQTMVNFLKNKF